MDWDWITCCIFTATDNHEDERQILQAFITHTQLAPAIFFAIYYRCARHPCLNILRTDYHHGITVTCPGFYGPQGRVIRMGLSSLTW